MADPAFAGFGRLEYELWGDASAGERTKTATQLGADVRGLVEAFPTLETDPADLPLRAHEILENSLQFELTGATDHGSHSNLATLRSNIDGSLDVFGAIAPLLADRYPETAAAARDVLDGLAQLVDSYRHPDGIWPAPSELAPTQRRQLNGAVSHALEVLAPIPALLEPPRANP